MLIRRKFSFFMLVMGLICVCPGKLFSARVSQFPYRYVENDILKTLKRLPARLIVFST